MDEIVHKLRQTVEKDGRAELAHIVRRSHPFSLDLLIIR